MVTFNLVSRGLSPLMCNNTKRDDDFSILLLSTQSLEVNVHCCVMVVQEMMNLNTDYKRNSDESYCHSKNTIPLN